MDVLLLSVSTGGGHLKAAEAISEYINCKFPDSRTLVVDTLKYISPVIDRLIVGSYLNTVKNTPQIYKKLYKLSEYDESISDISKAVSKILSYRLYDSIVEFNPSVIVCTHTLSLQMVSNLKQKNKLGIPVIAVITDFSNHSFWKLWNTDAFVVAHDYMKDNMMLAGISKEKIYTYGIPTSKNFLHKRDRQAALEELGLDNGLTALLMGGSLGFGQIGTAFRSLLNSKKVKQIIAVTGFNQKLKRQLEYYAQNTDKKVKIYGYTNHIADLMDASDLIITKPGGMTIAEALMKELPIFIISPIPGQEEENAHFLINSGVAAKILPGDNIDSILCQTLDNSLRVRHMKEMARCLSKPDSTKNIAALLENLSLKN